MVKRGIRYRCVAEGIERSVTKEVTEWSLDQAYDIASQIAARAVVQPFALQFVTYDREPLSKRNVVHQFSGFYFIGGHPASLQAILSNDDQLLDRPLLQSLARRGVLQVVVQDSPKEAIYPLRPVDAILDWRLPTRDQSRSTGALPQP